MTGLRSEFEPGTTRWAVRIAQWRAMGISPADFSKPKIAVVNSSSQLSVCYAHLDDLAKHVCDEIRAAGGLPFEIRTVAPSDFVTSAGRSARYLMPSRELIVNDIEVAVEGAVLDGMVLLSSCDKTTPGHLMAAGRLNVPAVVVIGGYQLGGHCNGEEVDIDDVYESVGSVAAGHMTIPELEEMASASICGPGVCAGLGTANSMHVVAEALGMTMPGSAPIRAASPEMLERATAAAHRIVDLIRDDVRPRAIMTEEAFENAVMVAIAMAGSVNVVRHLQAIAIESGLDIDIYEMVDRLGRTTPMLTAIRPNGLNSVSDFTAAGGARAVLSRLGDLIHGECITVSGQTIGEGAASFPVAADSIVRPVSDPVRSDPGLAMLSGSLAPDGALVKLGAVPLGTRTFQGPARVFETEEDAIDAIGDGTLVGGEVVVLRGLGPKGGPGTVFAAGFVAALNGAGLAAKLACVTDGELSGLNRGITVGQLMPEAAEGGPLALVHENDLIAIDLDARSIDLLVDDAELAVRRAAWSPPVPSDERSWLTFYGRLVGPLRRGAVLETK